MRSERISSLLLQFCKLLSISVDRSPFKDYNIIKKDEREDRTMTDLKINGLEEITTMTGTRKEIYNKIHEMNPLAIIDYRQAGVKIDNEWYLIIMKKVDKAFKVKIIWRINDNKQYEF